MLFCFKQKTAYEMRISDWSSDVCSSDLSKLVLYDQLLESNLPDDAYFATDLAAYFPKLLRQPYAAQIGRHRLRREIVVTVVSNDLINRVGINFVHRSEEHTSELQSLMRISYAVFCLKKQTNKLTKIESTNV